MSSPDQLADVLRICGEALTRDGLQRAAYLDVACGTNAALRKEVDALLLGSLASDSFLEQPPWQVMDAPVPLRLGHYCLQDKIGQGGMGVVYRARDERLERDVAIKVLPPGLLLDDSARRRFRKEALALSRLNHPNIAIVHDFDTDAGMDFLVEEFIDGTALDETVTFGPMEERAVIALGTQLADGLATAHANGILHRDLKPANIRVTREGRLKILDFGIATALRGGGVSTAAGTTESHGMTGTLPYMAPEQLTGAPLDGRTDIWGAGCVLYEMTTGRRPFVGEGTGLIEAILHQRLSRPSRLCPSISPGLEAIILKCLERDPASRYASAQELSSELTRLATGAGIHALTANRRRLAAAWAGAAMIAVAIALGGWYSLAGRAGPAPIRSIAVLPFEDLSGDPRQEYFADGMTEALIASLGRLAGLDKVSARTSVMRYRGTHESPKEIARELNVDALITGSVQRSGGRVRLNAHLVDPRTGQQAWTETYERELQDVLRLQDDVTSDIGVQLRVKLTAAQRAETEAARRVNPEAYEAYLMGRYHMVEFGRGERAGEIGASFDKAQEYFELALQKDPNYTDALLGIAMVWGLRGHMGVVPVREGWGKAEPFILTVLAANPASAEAHQELATKLAWCDWKWDSGVREYEKAVALNPNDPIARYFYSLTLFALRHGDDARKQMERAIEIDPFNPTFHEFLVIELSSEVVNRPDEAFRELDRLALLDPTRPTISHHRWLLFERRSQFPEAVAEARDWFTHGRLGAQGTAVAAALQDGFSNGDYKRAMVQAAAVMESRPITNPRDLLFIAQLYAAALQDERAIDCLYKAYDRNAGPLPYVNAWARFEHMRSNPRFMELLRRMNLHRADTS